MFPNHELAEKPVEVQAKYEWFDSQTLQTTQEQKSLLRGRRSMSVACSQISSLCARTEIRLATGEYEAQRYREALPCENRNLDGRNREYEAREYCSSFAPTPTVANARFSPLPCVITHHG